MFKKQLFLIIPLFIGVLLPLTSCQSLIPPNIHPGSSSSSQSSSSSSSSSFIVTFDSQGATVAANPSSIVVTTPATTVGALPIAPFKKGYTFAGWYTVPGGGGTQFTSSTIVKADITLFAYWSPNPVYTVTYDSQGGSAVGSQFVTQPATTVVALPTAPTLTAFFFNGWFTLPNGGGKAFTSTTVVTANITVYAYWKASGSVWRPGFLPNATGWTSVTYGNPLGVPTFVAVGLNEAATSPDGITWTSQPIPAGSWTSVTYGNNQFVAVGANQAATSPDGINWTAQFGIPVQAWSSVAFGNNIYFAVSSANVTTGVSSPDGIIWTSRSLGGPLDNWFVVAYGVPGFIAIGGIPGNSSSLDGIGWTGINTLAAAGTGWTSAAYGNGIFIAVAGNTSISAISPDGGTTWSYANSIPLGNWTSVTFGNGVFVAVATGGTLAATSPNGTVWTPQTLPFNTSWVSVTWGNGIFAAIANNLPAQNAAASY